MAIRPVRGHLYVCVCLNVVKTNVKHKYTVFVWNLEIWKIVFFSNEILSRTLSP